jgi:hypothetical protein
MPYRSGSVLADLHPSDSYQVTITLKTVQDERPQNLDQNLTIFGPIVTCMVTLGPLWKAQMSLRAPAALADRDTFYRSLYSAKACLRIDGASDAERPA